MSINLNDVFKQSFGYSPENKFSIEKAPGRLETSDLGQLYYGSDITEENIFFQFI